MKGGGGVPLIPKIDQAATEGPGYIWFSLNVNAQRPCEAHRRADISQVRWALWDQFVISVTRPVVGQIDQTHAHAHARKHIRTQAHTTHLPEPRLAISR